MAARHLPTDWKKLGVWSAFDANVGRMRIAAILTFAFICVLAPGVPSPSTIGVGLVILALVSFVVERVASIERIDLARTVMDHSTCLVLAYLVPEVWSAAALIIVANTIWWTLHNPSRIRFAVTAAAPTMFMVLGLVTQPPGWLSVSVVTAALVALYHLLGQQLRDTMRASEADLSHALGASGAIVHVSDPVTRNVQSVNGADTYLGWTLDEWAEMNHTELIHPDDVDAFMLDEADFALGDVVERRARFKRSDGTYAWLRDVSRVVPGTFGELHLRGFTMDVTDAEYAQEVIRRQAETDELTGLANRSVLVSELERRLNAGETFALVLLDLDEFKTINDTLGHSFGDGVLVEIGSRLRRMGRASDAVVRLGGDEFALIVANMRDDDAATILARRIAKECGRVMSLQGVTISTAASIGIALAPRDGADAQTLLRHSDIAMYEAKRGRSSFQIFDPEIQQAPLQDVMLSASVGAALEGDEFVLHFQPKVDMTTGQVIGFEGLARWQHPELGLLTPDRFIHLVTLGTHSRTFVDRVIHQGATFAAECRAAGFPVPVAVNISARSLFDDSLPERTAASLDRNHLEAGLLTIEITEHDIMDKSADNSRILHRLKQLGVTLSIDDFGTGYSSLARLVDLPIQEIKIDRRFVSRMLLHETDAVIVRSIVDLARNLQLNVIAEGVETQREAEQLVAAGCTQAQGYLYSPAVPSTEALAMLDGSFPAHQPSEPPGSFGGNPAFRADRSAGIFNP